MPTLVLLRHGQSAWNLENRFTGWWDVDLSPRGEEEAAEAGGLLASAGVLPDVVHTSVLTRAIRTANLALDVAGRGWIPVVRHWRLNERHYGALTGLDKAQTRDQYGDEQFMAWRRSFDTPPPPMDRSSEWSVHDDPRYAGLPAAVVPATECLADVIVRWLPYWEDAIAPELIAGKVVLVVAHGNSLRAMIKHLEGISTAEITGLEVPTGVPIVYSLSAELTVESKRELGDPAAIAAAAEAVRRQGERRA
ncbi:phosphoglyceromutase [Acidiferrimicrobium sp. IK]|uniref:phosphoglyceromutase n=1 Tax=Acidiferrimicrobium sp. IK TaxID=2871700 RepID=UPI0021CB78CA|nr:phosphoglyceromutase [Acidiferrimicrobium sp. IK]